MSDKDFKSLLGQIGRTVEQQTQDAYDAPGRVERDKFQSVQYTAARPNWCAQCSKERPHAPPTALPQCAPGSGLCYEHGRRERALREQLRAAKAAKTAPVRSGRRDLEDE